MALVEGDAEPGDRARGDTLESDPGTGDTTADGTGRYALVKARGGTVLADGDEVFETRAAALAAFERARALGWALHATPGLVAGLPGSGIAELDIAALEEAASRAGAAIQLQAAGQARPRGGWTLLSALGLAVLAGIAGAWFERDGLRAWLAGPAPVEAPAFHPEPAFSAAVDGAALIAACRRALIENPPFLPAWRIERIACAARFADPELTALSPELAGAAGAAGPLAAGVRPCRGAAAPAGRGAPLGLACGRRRRRAGLGRGPPRPGPARWRDSGSAVPGLAPGRRPGLGRRWRAHRLRPWCGRRVDDQDRRPRPPLPGSPR